MDIDKCKLILATSIDKFGDVCTCIEDKGNGNAVAANDIDDEYEALFLHAPEMYEMLEMLTSMPTYDAKHFLESDDSILKLLEKARGES